MSETLPMVIPVRYNSPGYVYFIRYHHARNCYKIGSTGNLFNRLGSLGGRYCDIELLAYGYAHDRFWAEKHIQSLFYEKSNHSHAQLAIWNRKKFEFEFRGDITSTEHFILKPREAQDVITMMGVVLPSLQIGTTHPFYCHKWHHPTLEPEDEREHFYDFENHFYMKYPTKFRDGIPVYDTVD